MSSQRSRVGSVVLVTAALGLGLAGCTSDGPAEVPSDVSAAEATATPRYGPFPGATTIFVDVENTSGIEDGSRVHPFNTLREGLTAARGGAVVGVAPGVYTQTFGPSLTPNYVIDGLRDFQLLGMGPAQTTIRGDHSFSLIRVQNGASGLIKGFTIEHGGHISHSVGGGIQVIGKPNSVTLSVQNVVLQDNEAVSGGGISAEGLVSLSLRNVIIANNRGSNCCGGVVLEGAHGNVTATFRNTTITANTASFHAGGVVVDNVARLNLINSIVWNNSLSEVAQFSGARVSASFSDVGERLFPGPGNLSANPRFHDPGRRDYRLRPLSPVIDAGTNTNAPQTDIRGLRRPVDGNGDGVAVTDMGAFEFGKVFSPSGAGSFTADAVLSGNLISTGNPITYTVDFGRRFSSISRVSYFFVFGDDPLDLNDCLYIYPREASDGIGGFCNPNATAQTSRQLDFPCATHAYGCDPFRDGVSGGEFAVLSGLVAGPEVSLSLRSLTVTIEGEGP